LIGFVGFFFVGFGCDYRCDGLSIFSSIFAAVAICLIPAAILFLLGSKFGYDLTKSKKFSIFSSNIIHYNIVWLIQREFQSIFFTIFILNLFVLAWLRSRTYAFFAVALVVCNIVALQKDYGSVHNIKFDLNTIL
jgi:hypothetical protein